MTRAKEFARSVVTGSVIGAFVWRRELRNMAEDLWWSFRARLR